MRKFFQLWNKRTLAVMLLGFSSGLPLVLIGSTLQAWYTVAGVSLMTIGTLTLVQQPYIFKFLWAPLMDRYTPIKKLGRRRGWIFLMQTALFFTLLVMAYLKPETHPWLLADMALIVAFFSATQDISIDAYRTDILAPDEKGLGSALTNIGYRMAMLVAGAVALILAGEIGWRVTYIIMSVLILVEALVTLWAPKPISAEMPPRSLIEAVIEPMHDFFKRGAKPAFIILLFIMLYKIADALALALNTAFLIRGIGFSLAAIGGIYKIVSLIATLLGSFFGGLWFNRLGLYRSLMIFGVLQTAANLSFMWLALVGKSYLVMIAAVFSDYFCGGLASVAMIVLLMNLCNHRFTATQYALFSAVAAIPRVFIGPLAALLVDHFGWAEFYFISFFFGLPALILLWWLKKSPQQKEIFKLS